MTIKTTSFSVQDRDQDERSLSECKYDITEITKQAMLFERQLAESIKQNNIIRNQRRITTCKN